MLLTNIHTFIYTNTTFLALLSRSVVYYTVPDVVLTFESVEETLDYDHSNENCWAVLSCGAVY